MSSQPLKIFLIDDDPDDQEIFLSVVENLYPQFQWTTAFNGQQGIDKLLNDNLQADVIFLDLNMPLMNGMQFLREIKNHKGISSIPISILSTSSNPSVIQQAKDLGAQYFITKPDRFSEWENALKKFFEQFMSTMGKES